MRPCGYGTGIEIVPQRWVERAAALLPRGRETVIPGGPHVVNYTTPLEFSRIVRAFVGREVPRHPQPSEFDLDPG